MIVNFQRSRILINKLNVNKVLLFPWKRIPVTGLSTSSNRVIMSGKDSFELRHQVASEKESNSKWTTYRVASIGVLGACASTFICPGNPVVDFATVTLLTYHNHYGIKSVIADYAPLMFKEWFVNILYVTWLIISVCTLGLLYAFNYNNIGFSQAVVNFFKI